MRRPNPKTAAFTLIEILVVVAIIALLIAILVPSLAAVNRTKRKTATIAQMHGISMACENYYTLFNAYPGAIAETVNSNNTGFGNFTVSQFSDSQALVVSLTRAFFTADMANANPKIPDILAGGNANNPPFWVATDTSVTPRDYSAGGSAGYKTYDALMNPKSADLSSAISLQSTADGGATGVLASVPTFIDSAYGSDALPILYYRAARKYDSSVSNGAAPMQPVYNIDATVPANFAAFYTQSNDWLSPSNATANNADFAVSQIGRFKSNPNTLRDLLFNPGSSANTYVAKGAYVLISAGTDRIYGPNSNNVTDDIIISGGN